MGRANRKLLVYALVSASTALQLLILSCSSRELTVNGQIFIVTRGAESIKLGLVDVHLVPEKEVLGHINVKRMEAKREIPRLDSLMNETGIAIDKAQREYEIAMRNQDIARDKFISDPMGYSEEYERIKAHTDEKLYAVTALRGELSSMYEKRASYYSSAEFLFIGLPNGISSTKTDSDGNFTLTMPKSGTFVIAATASREIMDQSEHYYWLIKLDAKSAAKGKILLSNHNLIQSGSLDAIMVDI